MPSEDIASPPYPTESTNADGLYRTLKALREWLLKYRDSHNSAVGQDVIPAPKSVPNKAAYLTQPVSTQFGHLMYIRRLREQWDHLVRMYEDNWDDPACLRGRVIMFQTATIVFNSAFTPLEHREATAARDADALRRMLENVQTSLTQFMEPRPYDPPQKDPGRP